MSNGMTPERWVRIEELYHAALGLGPAERDAHLAEACAGDERLRREVESLIASQEQEGSFMDSPVVRITDTPPPPEPRLPPGERLGSYQVLGPLGEGGMGVVYLARDTRLNRKVALKLLPPSLRSDPERLRRLKREAQAASSLNHPNILTIYEVGEAEQGAYIASEYVEGETLRDRMRAGLDLEDAIDIAVQMASALEAAHSAGIVHRDVKPENVMVRRDGYVKVLDFGLAKVSEAQAAAVAGTEAPTRSLVATEPGVVMGTVRYMSPEQARGQEVDARTDVFSLGVVLYEMVACRPPFEGETASDLIAAILKEEPAPLAQHSVEVPEQLQRITGKALRKDKEARYQAVRELLDDLKGLKEGLRMEFRLRNSAQPAVTHETVRTSGAPAGARTAGGPAVETAGAQAPPDLSSARYIISEIRRHRGGAAAALAALFISTAAIGYALYRFTARPHLTTSSPNIKLIGLTNSGKATSAAVSPDGRHVAYVTSDAGQQSLWVRQVPTSGNVQVVQPSDASYWGLAFSRDGNYLYYFSQGKGDAGPALYQMPALGGAPKKLIEGVVNSNGAGPVTLSPDGRQLAFVREYPAGESALVVANSDGSGERKIAARQGRTYFSAAAWSPDGGRIACAGGGRKEDGSAYGDVVEVAVGGGAEKPITAQGWNWIGDVAWLPDGAALLVTAATDQAGDSIDIWQIPYPDGPARKVTADLNGYSGLSLSADSGTLVTTHSRAVRNIWTQPAGDAARATQITSGAAASEGHSGIDWTPGGRIVYSSNAGGRPDIWSMDADGGNRKQLTVDLGSSNFGLSVSPDGQHIVFVSGRAGRPNVWRADADGGNAKQMTDGVGEFNPVFMPDGQWVLYGTYVSSSPAKWRVPAAGGHPEPMPGPYPDVLAVSPDGTLTAYVPPGGQGRGKRIAVGPSAGGDTVRVFELPPSAVPRRMRWSPDGRALTYIVNRGGAGNVWSQPVDGGPARQLTYFKTEGISSFAWSRDGKQLALARGTATSDVVLIKDFR